MLFLCQPLQTVVAKQNSAKLCDMLGSEPDLQTHVKIWEVHVLKIGELKLLILGWFQLDKTILDAEK